MQPDHIRRSPMKRLKNSGVLLSGAVATENLTFKIKFLLFDIKINSTSDPSSPLMPWVGLGGSEEETKKNFLSFSLPPSRIYI